MSLMLDKKLVNVNSDGDDENNYRINVADFIKSRHMNDVLNTNANKKNSQNIILNKYNIDNIGGGDDDDDELIAVSNNHRHRHSNMNGSTHNTANNENSVINQGDYRTHFIRKFKESKSRISSRNQYSAIYVKQPNIEKTWNLNHMNNHNLLNDNRMMTQQQHQVSSTSNQALVSNSDLLINESILNTDNNNNKYVQIGSIEKWSSHISKTTTTAANNGVHTNTNSNSNNSSNNSNSSNKANAKASTIRQKTPAPMTYNLLTHVISNPLERENTKESLNMQYDKPIDIHRDLIPTPHAYLKLNDEPQHNTSRKSIIQNQTQIAVPTFTTATLSSISNKTATSNGTSLFNSSNNTYNAKHFDQHILRDEMNTPDNYVTIETPSNNISIYSKLTLPITSISSINSSSLNNKANTSRSKNNNSVSKELINDPNLNSKRRNTFSISPHKNPGSNSQQATKESQKKASSFRKPPKINEDIVPSRTSSPIFEEPSVDKIFTVVPPSTSRRSKNALFNPTSGTATANSNSTLSNSLIMNKKPFVSTLQPQQFKSTSTTNISPRKVVFKKKPIQSNSKPKFDPNNCELKEFKHCIITDLKIGEGEFGETFQGYRYDLGAPVKVAAKRLKNVKPNGEIDTSNLNPLIQLNNPNISVINTNTENILAEVCVLSQLGKHDFVIDYLGVHNYSDTMYMIFEFAEKGDLKRLLDNCRKNSRPEININLLWKMKFAYEISAGMEYISSLGIVHKDLAARNILLQKDYTCKIADFGCCKTDFMVKRPIRWMSPESLNKSLFTSASDVWSFGIILWEIWTLGVIPYPGMTDDEVVSRINQWYRLYKPHDCPNEIYNIMSQCWKEYYRARPRFTQISHRIKDLYETVLENKGVLPVV